MALFVAGILHRGCFLLFVNDIMRFVHVICFLIQVQSKVYTSQKTVAVNLVPMVVSLASVRVF